MVEPTELDQETCLNVSSNCTCILLIQVRINYKKQNTLVNTSDAIKLCPFRSYEIQLSIFKVMNSMKIGVAVWKSMDFW